MNWYLEPLKSAFDWQGRATRKEYWLFYLFSFVSASLLFAVILLIGNNAGQETLAGLLFWAWLIYAIFIAVATVGMTVRRLHDIDKSGQDQLLFLVPLVGPTLWLIFMCRAGTPGENQYGWPNQSAPLADKPKEQKPQSPSRTSSQTSNRSQPVESSEITTSPFADDPKVAELREQLAAAEAAAEQKAEAQNVQRARDDVVARIKNLEEALADAEIQIEQLKKPDNS